MPDLAARSKQLTAQRTAAPTVISRLIADKVIGSVSSVGTYVLDPADPASRPERIGPDVTGRDRVEKVLRARIANGTYPVGKKIPALTRLGKELGVPEWKVRQAVRRLADARLVMIVFGRGTVVTDPRAPTAGPVHRVNVGDGREEDWVIPRPGVTPAAHIREVVTQRLSNGMYPPGGRLPTRRALAEEFGVSVSAVQNAFRQLKKQRLIFSHVSHKALFAAPVSEQPPSGVLPSQDSV
ncbi:GntR family transcriptional regulator [Streptomyces sp. GQFP]|uniref:GntR family transcriptional regulator n=1 Tax=Streptomyces sp. GQFP TaxID=2907545 RepID=UPI001F20FB37|nr:GntR family transcriptional regulator [Streptomyces sp. GQFP]UIX34266.1 GntR family transcriptional regulator [Streptomyces sp. GQFP]